MRQTYEEWRLRQSDKWAWFQNHVSQQARIAPNILALELVMERDLRMVYPLAPWEKRKA